MEQIGKSFVWWFGVVEGRGDPLQIGRVRVRIYSWHSPDKIRVPIEALQWAEVVSPITSAALGDVGQSPSGLLEGSWVIGFFKDGTEAQQPMVLGSLSGIPDAYPDFNQGFSDPNQKYPYRIQEPDINRLSRGGAHQVLEYMRAHVDDLTNEPATQYRSQYPHNHVRQTESGHIEEWDDTPNYERIHRLHRSGSREEIHPDGTRVTRTVANNYTITYGSDFVRVRGNVNVYVDGNCSLYTRGNFDHQVDGNYTITTGGSFQVNVGAEGSILATNDLNLESQANIDLKAKSDTNADVGGEFLFTNNGDAASPTLRDALENNPVSNTEYKSSNWVFRSEKAPEAVTEEPQQLPVNPSPSDFQSTTGVCSLTQENTTSLLNTIGQRESNNNYAAQNTIGYLGKYQFGAAALVDTGYVDRAAYKSWVNGGRPGGQTGFLNDSSNWRIDGGKQAFLSSPNAQEDAMIKLLNQNCRTLRRNGTITPDSTQKEIAGYLMAAHLGGAGNATKLGRDPNFGFQDAYGTSLQSYFDLGSGAVTN